MPDYEFECKECHHTFELHLSLKEHDEHKVECPKCKSKNVEQLFRSFFAKTDRKS
jgi:putative FmdB family regulatory protein